MRAYAKIGEYREGIEYKAGGSTTTTTTTVQTSTNTAQSHTVAGSDRDLAYQVSENAHSWAEDPTRLTTTLAEESSFQQPT